MIRSHNNNDPVLKDLRLNLTKYSDDEKKLLEKAFNIGFGAITADIPPESKLAAKLCYKSDLMKFWSVLEDVFAPHEIPANMAAVLLMRGEQAPLNSDLVKMNFSDNSNNDHLLVRNRADQFGTFVNHMNNGEYIQAEEIVVGYNDETQELCAAYLVVMVGEDTSPKGNSFNDVAIPAIDNLEDAYRDSHGDLSAVIDIAGNLKNLHADLQSKLDTAVIKAKDKLIFAERAASPATFISQSYRKFKF